MNTVDIDCGNGWTVRVRAVDGRPLITIEKALDDGYISESMVTSIIGGEVVLTGWHPSRHEDEA